MDIVIKSEQRFGYDVIMNNDTLVASEGTSCIITGLHCITGDNLKIIIYGSNFNAKISDYYSQYDNSDFKTQNDGSYIFNEIIE